MVEFSHWDDRKELSSLWAVSFDDSPRSIRFFFQNRFRPEYCLVYRKNGKIFAAVYLLPAMLTMAGVNYQAHYIYAAATLPDYRGRGCMSALLESAAVAGSKRGDQYSVVLPATEDLYRFYEKASYLRWYKASEVVFSQTELADYTKQGVGKSGLLLPDFKLLSSERNDWLENRESSLKWDAAALAFAAGYAHIFGGGLLVLKEKDSFAYALYEKEGQTCLVTELMSGKVSQERIAAELLRRTQAERFRFRLPAGENFLGKAGTEMDFGMIRPLSGHLPEITKRETAPYLGLTLS